MAKSNGAIVKADQYEIVKKDPAQVAAIVKANMGSLGVSQFDLDRAKVPSGGITKWEVPTLDGSDFVDEVEGVIVGMKDCRVYWKMGLDDGGGNTPPDCYADDCLTGVGDPGGSCQACPFSQFGSAEKGNGQACAQRRLLFVVRPTSTLPLVISLPPTSLRNAARFFLRIGGQGVAFWSCVTTIGLEKAQNGVGIEYAKATFKVREVLSDELAAKFAKMKDEFTAMVQRTAVDPTITESAA